MTTTPDTVFGLEVPREVAGVPEELLVPRRVWADRAAYYDRAGKLADMFRANFEQFADGVSAEVAAAEPRSPAAVG